MSEFIWMYYTFLYKNLHIFFFQKDRPAMKTSVNGDKTNSMLFQNSISLSLTNTGVDLMGLYNCISTPLV
jgi:hypothetical protein